MQGDVEQLEQKVAQWVRAEALPAKVSEARLYSISTSKAVNKYENTVSMSPSGHPESLFLGLWDLIEIPKSH